MVVLGEWERGELSEAMEPGTRASAEEASWDALLPSLPPGQGPPSIPLSLLLEFAVHKTYQELTVLAELLPKKNDMERKISIVKLAYDSRQLFIRLLGLVKWLKTAGKVKDATARICFFVEDQCGHLVDTADRLARLSREELPLARLPLFQVPAAVDVLCKGSYPRLPLAIKSRFVPEDAIRPREEALVLSRLNQLIQHRLLTASAPPLPARMSQVEIRNGAVRLGVPGEWRAWLTLLGEAAEAEWRLLHLHVALHDDDIGDGAPLVHPRQLDYLHRLIQTRLASSSEPIQELYAMMSRFCVSLQLDLLHCQALNLIAARLQGHLSVAAYEQGRLLRLAYWAGGAGQGGFGLELQVAREGLRVRHQPPRAADADGRLPSLQTEGAGQVSLEALLSESTLVRAKDRLRDTGRLLAAEGVGVELTGSTAPQLSAVLLHPEQAEEVLKVGVNLFTGRLILELPCLDGDKEAAATLASAQEVLGGLLPQPSKLRQLLSNLRLSLFAARCRRGLAGLPLKVSSEAPSLEAGKALAHLWPHRLFAQFLRSPAYHLVLSFRESAGAEVEVQYHLVHKEPAADASLTLIPLEPASALLGQEPIGAPVQRRREDEVEPPRKRPRVSAGQVGEVGWMAGVVEHRLPLYLLHEELGAAGCRFAACQMDGVLGGTETRVLELPLTTPEERELWDSVVSCSFRLHLGTQYPATFERRRSAWILEIVFAHNLFPRDSEANSVTLSHPVQETKRAVQELIANFANFSRLHRPVRDFAQAYEERLRAKVQVQKPTAFKVNIAYGPRLAYLLVLKWSPTEAAFHLSFGGHGPHLQAQNPHAAAAIAPLLSKLFNDTKDLTQLVEVLVATIGPLLALHQLRPEIVRVTEAGASSAGSLRLAWALLATSPTTFRLVYRSQLALELKVAGEGQVGVRDLSFGSGQIYAPILGLKAFLAAQAGAFVVEPETLPSYAQPSRSGRQVGGPGSVSAPDPSPWGPGSVGNALNPGSVGNPLNPGSVGNPLGPGSVGNPMNMLGSPAAASSPANVNTPNPTTTAAMIPPSPLGFNTSSQIGPGSVPPPSSNTLSSSFAGPASVPPSTTANVPASPASGPSALQRSRSFLPSAASREDWVQSYYGVRLSEDGLLKICSVAEGSKVSPLETLLRSLYTLRQYEKGLGGLEEQEKREGKPEDKRDVTELELGPAMLSFVVPRRALSPHKVQISVYLASPSEPELGLKLAPSSEAALSPAALATAERYFAERIGPLGSHEALLSFQRMVAMSGAKTAAAFVAVMGMELEGLGGAGKGESGRPEAAWRLALLHLVPNSSLLPLRCNIAAFTGMAALRFNKEGTSALFFLKLRRVGEAETELTLPLVYDLRQNQLRLHSVTGPADLDQSPQAPRLRQVQTILERFKATHSPASESSILPALTHIVHHLS